MILEGEHEHVIEEENYFVSMTDMMVGLIFIFIIMLMYFALQFNQVTEKLTGADQTRTEILEQIQASLKADNIDVRIDTQNGILRLSDSILFASGSKDLSTRGQDSIGKLSAALMKVLPCYTEAPAGVRPASCAKSDHRIESVYIEGHTDTDAYSSGMLRDNLDLSVVRATNTYRALTDRAPSLLSLCAKKSEGACEPVLSASGYGERRPINTGSTPEAKSANRRIDLRIIMITPDSGQTVAEVDRALQQS